MPENLVDRIAALCQAWSADAPAPLGDRLLKGGRLLRDALPHRRVEVVERVLSRYLDEAYLSRVLDAGLAERLREKRVAR